MLLHLLLILLVLFRKLSSPTTANWFPINSILGAKSAESLVEQVNRSAVRFIHDNFVLRSGRKNEQARESIVCDVLGGIEESLKIAVNLVWCLVSRAKNRRQDRTPVRKRTISHFIKQK